MAVPHLAQTFATPPAPEAALLGPQTAGILLRNIIGMYRRHFGILMASAVLPVAPFLLLIFWLSALESPWVVLGVVPYMVAAFVAGGALTVVISDICLGNRPTLVHAYRRVLGQQRWLHLLATGLLLTLMMWVGTLLLVLPGLWVMARGFLSSIVVTLEGRSARDAIKRSFALTHGQAWRIMGLTLLPLLLAYVAMVVCVMVVAIVASLTLGDATLAGVLVQVVSFALGLALFAPVMGITMVLLYYDQRVRREAYDMQALAEDLMR